ncbi:unnamed protein product [Cercospora beticola]|nr:unnamed protein product [Cercospora beticola]
MGSRQSPTSPALFEEAAPFQLARLATANHVANVLLLRSSHHSRTAVMELGLFLLNRMRISGQSPEQRIEAVEPTNRRQAMINADQATRPRLQSHATRGEATNGRLRRRS